MARPPNFAFFSRRKTSKYQTGNSALLRRPERRSWPERSSRNSRQLSAVSHQPSATAWVRQHIVDVLADEPSPSAGCLVRRQWRKAKSEERRTKRVAFSSRLIADSSDVRLLITSPQGTSQPWPNT